MDRDWYEPNAWIASRARLPSSKSWSDAAIPRKPSCHRKSGVAYRVSGSGPPHPPSGIAPDETRQKPTDSEPRLINSSEWNPYGAWRRVLSSVSRSANPIRKVPKIAETRELRHRTKNFGSAAPYVADTAIRPLRAASHETCPSRSRVVTTESPSDRSIGRLSRARSKPGGAMGSPAV